MSKKGSAYAQVVPPSIERAENQLPVKKTNWPSCPRLLSMTFDLKPAGIIEPNKDFLVSQLPPGAQAASRLSPGRSMERGSFSRKAVTFSEVSRDAADRLCPGKW